VGRFGFVLVGLYLTLILVWVVVGDLVCLRECVVVGYATSIVTETTEVGLCSLLFFYVDCNNLYLVVGKSNFDFELIGHDELVGFD
jgi:hypothetical protein